MATFDFDDLFAQYYTLYRAEATTPASTDDEYTIALRFAKQAINRWANYDGVYWKELFTNLVTLSTGATTTITTGTKTYTGPTTMREAGGFVRVIDASGNTVQYYGIIDPQDAQFKNDMATFAYFTGDPSNGWTLNINPAPPSSLNGLRIDYIYYKNPTYPTTGSSKTEMANPNFIVHHMLANRYRASRNWGAYQTAMRDAEEFLKLMKIDNDSGNWADPWKLNDTSGAQFGDSSGGTSGIF